MFVGYRAGVIYGIWTCKQQNDADHAGIVELADDHPDLVAFLAPKPPIRTLSVERLAEVLIAKGALTMADVNLARMKD